MTEEEQTVKRRPLWLITVLHWCELMGDALIVSGGLWGLYTFWRIVTKGYVCYNEPMEAMALWELVLSAIIIVFGIWHGVRDARGMWANRESKLEAQIEEDLEAIGDMMDQMRKAGKIERGDLGLTYTDKAVRVGELVELRHPVMEIMCPYCERSFRASLYTAAENEDGEEESQA